MAGTANFELLPTDYNRVKMNGYVRKIKLKEESHKSIENKYANFSSNEEIVSPIGIVEENQDPELMKRTELVTRLEEKISAIIPDYSRVENVTNRAIKIKSIWKDNCIANGDIMFANLNKNVLSAEDEGFQTDEVVELNEIKPLEEVIEDNVREDIVVSPEREEEPIEEEAPFEEEIQEENSIEEEMEEPQEEQVSKYSERALNPNYDMSGEVNDTQVLVPSIPEIPKIDLRLLRKNDEIEEEQEELDIVSSDSKLDMDVESDISERLDSYSDVEESNNLINYDLSNDSEIDEMKAALESIKQKKIEQEQSNRAKQLAEEARREEEAKLAEIKRKNIEAVEKIKIQKEAISEDIEENLRQEEEERHRIEEIRKQRELQEQLLGELENEILDI